MSRALQLHTAPSPRDRGPLLSPDGAAQLFPPDAGINAEWVRRHVRVRVKIGRKVLFYERDVLDFIADHRSTA